jgi:hypothetical protein
MFAVSSVRDPPDGLRLPKFVELHLAKGARRDSQKYTRADDGGQNARGLASSLRDCLLQKIGYSLASQAAQLRRDCVLGGTLPEPRPAITTTIKRSCAMQITV